MGNIKELTTNELMNVHGGLSTRTVTFLANAWDAGRDFGNWLAGQVCSKCCH